MLQVKIVWGCFATLLVVPCFGQNEFCAGHPDSPELLSGSASCLYESSSSGSQTRIDLAESSVISWGDFDVKENDTLEFRFLSGDGAVLNRVSGDGVVNIDGGIFSNGLVGIEASDARAISVTGIVEAEGIVLTTHAIESVDGFLSGDQVRYSQSSDRVRSIDLRGGALEATSGDAVVIGDRINVLSVVDQNDRTQVMEGSINSSGRDTIIVAGNSVEYSTERGRPSLKIEQNPIDERNGSIFNGGNISGNDVVLHASRTITNGVKAEIAARQGTVFLSLDSDLNIVSNGDITGIIESTSPITNDGTVIDPDSDPLANSASISRFPALKKPSITKGKAEKVSKQQVKYKSGQLVGSVDVQDKEKRNRSQFAQAKKKVIKRSSFFGVRAK